MARALDRGILVVAAAGNDGQQDDGDVQSPASLERVIAVGAIDRDGVIAPFSSAGADSEGVPPQARVDPHRKPELVAPGVAVASIFPGERYVFVDGTSPAAAHLAGILALLLQEHPSYRHSVSGLVPVKEALMEGARPASDQAAPHDEHYGYGVVQGLASSDLL